VPIVTFTRDDGPSDATTAADDAHHLVLLEGHLRCAFRFKRIHRAIQPRKERALAPLDSNPAGGIVIIIIIIILVLVIE
jgi:hypothetical protein